MPRTYDKSSFQSDFSRKKTGVDIGEYMARGAVPDYLLGVTGKKYGSQFGAAAHTAEQMNRLDKMVNNSVDDELVFSVGSRDATGKVVPKTAPFEFGGKVLRPNEKGLIRITDQGKIDVVTQIAEYRKKRTNDLMEKVRLGDDVAAYIFGLGNDEWAGMCKANGALPSGLKMHDDLKKLDCSVEYINSLPPSLTQTQSVAKLRKIVEFYEKNVNIEHLSSIAETQSNMNDGHNVLDVKDASKHPFATAVTDAAGNVTGWEAPKL